MKTISVIVLVLALLAAEVVAQERSSEYEGPAGSGKQFQKAKRNLLDTYAKAKNTKWTQVSEKLGDKTYSLTYKFPTAEILADFQKWQYEQAEFKNVLEKTSKKAKGLSGRRLLA